MKKLTERQNEYLSYIKKHIETEDNFPSPGWLALKFDVSRSAARDMILALEAKGLVEKNITRTKWRLSRHEKVEQ